LRIVAGTTRLHAAGETAQSKRYATVVRGPKGPRFHRSGGHIGESARPRELAIRTYMQA
jgi:hypothetical protein